MKKLLATMTALALSLTTAAARDRSAVPDAVPDGK